MGHKRIPRRDKNKGKKKLFINRKKQRQEKLSRKYISAGMAIPQAVLDLYQVKDFGEDDPQYGN